MSKLENASHDTLNTPTPTPPRHSAAPPSLFVSLQNAFSVKYFRCIQCLVTEEIRGGEQHVGRGI